MAEAPSWTLGRGGRVLRMGSGDNDGITDSQEEYCFLHDEARVPSRLLGGANDRIRPGFETFTTSFPWFVSPNTCPRIP